MNEYQSLPDMQTLTAMANEIFQALPIAEPIVSGLQPSVPIHSTQRPQFSSSSKTPELSLPQVEQQLVATPMPVYYFADNAKTYSSANLQIDQLTEVSPQPFGLPGKDDFINLLAENRFITPTSKNNSVNQLQIPHTLETHASSDYHQPQVNSDDRLLLTAFHLPEEQNVQKLLAAEFRFNQFDTITHSAAAAATPAPESRFYFLESNTQSVFGNTAKQSHSVAGFDVNAVRRDFPILAERVNGKPLVWFDNAATTQKPQSVIDRISYFYEHENSNIHRAVHELAARATDAYEGARNKIAKFIGAKFSDEIIFVRGATEGINFLANTFAQKHVGEDDEIIVSQLEHHANIVPWHILATKIRAKIRVIPVDDSGQILLDEYRKLINNRTKLVSVTQVSNALGTVTPIKEIIDIAHAAGVPVIVDGAQSVSHMRVNMQELNADFFVFSGHKVFGPTGIGIVYGKVEHLKNMPYWQGGGNMIADVTFERILFQNPPNRFEAGTGNIADAVGLGAAIDYVERIGLDRIARYEHDLLAYATQRLQPIPGIRLIGTATNKASVLSFVLDGYKTEEVGTELNREGIAVRSGHHCAQPILRRFGVETTVRPSFAFYNTYEEIDLMVSVIERLVQARR